MKVNPIEVQKHLSGIDYPAKKEELIATAERNGAPQDVIETLQAVGQENFEGPDQVQAALA